MNEQPQRRSWEQTTFVWFIRAVYVAVILVLGQVCLEMHSRRPVLGKDKLAYGDFYAFQYEGAPWCCIYVGLTTNESASFTDAFTHFAESYGIHKVVKHYMSYLGQGCANYMSDHAAFFVYPMPTEIIIDSHDKSDSATLRERSLKTGEWRSAFRDYVFWPTNGSRITEGGREFVAPFTGRIHMLSYDKQYSVKDFKTLAESLQSAIRSNWPGRAVEAFIYEGNER